MSHQAVGSNRREKATFKRGSPLLPSGSLVLNSRPLIQETDSELHWPLSLSLVPICQCTVLRSNSPVRRLKSFSAPSFSCLKIYSRLKEWSGRTAMQFPEFQLSSITSDPWRLCVRSLQMPQEKCITPVWARRKINKWFQILSAVDHLSVYFVWENTRLPPTDDCFKGNQ